MALAAGTKLGPYKIQSPLGAGGMGEVYRARDSKLGREVALKVLAAEFSSDPERMARFAREAQVLASLNHPSIAHIYGLEESGGVRALVMELVEGSTLAGRIRQGALPLDESLGIAKQIAGALEYAHEQGIVHRDLKPANVKVTPDGTVKVLDFGLAKAIENTPATENISNSPTLSMEATRAGVILGTVAYMSPEQAKGKTVDRRADIWAFGVVLYEMLVGKQLYEGETAPEILAHVITKEPAWDSLPASTPGAIRHLLERCLTKDPKTRLQAIGEARIIIDRYLANPSASTASIERATVEQPTWRPALPWAIAGLFGTVCLALLALWRPWQSPLLARPMQLEVAIGADAKLRRDYSASALLSPDGTHIVFATVNAAGVQQLYIRSLDELQATPLAGTEGARDPFFSPDGQWIAFFTETKLKKISSQGGAVVNLCDAHGPRGGSWSEDGTIAFSPGASGLYKVSSAGGVAAPLASLDTASGEATQRWPQVLPGGKGVLFTSNTSYLNYEESSLVILSLADGRRKTVYRGGFYGRYLPSGHLVFIHEGTLFAVPFDLKRLETIGQAAPVVEQVISNLGIAAAQFSFSQSGTLAYLRGTSAQQDVSIEWLTSDGKFQPLRQTPAAYYNPAFSPDGKRLAVDVHDGRRSDIWIYDWQRDTFTRLTLGGDGNTNPVWTPDGQRIVYTMRDKTDGSYNLYWIKAGGAGDAQRLTRSKAFQRAGSWSPDGKVLTIQQLDPGSPTGWDIYAVSLEGDERTGWKFGEPKPFLATRANELCPRISPDGRWLAYISDESGPDEVYVRPFPGPAGKWQISSGGGAEPVWSRTSKQLFYSTNNQKIMVVTYSASGESFEAGKPALWSEGRFADRAGYWSTALHPDGKRFAVFKSPAGSAEPELDKVVLIFDFFDELRRKVPAEQ
jgi:Tol biopolymer transport system component